MRQYLNKKIGFLKLIGLISKVSFLFLDIKNGSIFISLMGISSAFGKVAFGAICTFFNISSFKVFVVAQVL